MMVVVLFTGSLFLPRGHGRKGGYKVLKNTPNRYVSAQHFTQLLIRF